MVISIGAILVVVLLAGVLLRRSQVARAVQGAGRGPRAHKREIGCTGKGRHPAATRCDRASQPEARGRHSRRYAAVRINKGRDSCAAVGEFRDQVILAADAPALPLPGCNRQQCDCRYEFLPDRRQEDRRTPYSVAHGMIFGDAALYNRRGRDRRAAGN